jgi:hypothetical protein
MIVDAVIRYRGSRRCPPHWTFSEPPLEALPCASSAATYVRTTPIGPQKPARGRVFAWRLNKSSGDPWGTVYERRPDNAPSKPKAYRI